MLPDYGCGSLADLMPAVLTCLGQPGLGEVGEAGARPGLDLPPSDRVVVLLVDGLGLDAVIDHADLAAYLATLLAAPASRRLTSVFPTTTPIALTSLGTGLTPGQHGITGLLLRLTTGQVVNTLAIPAQTDLRVLQPQPTVFDRAVKAGIEVTRVGPASFDGQGLTEAGLRGGTYAAGETVAERIAAVASAVRRGDRSLTYVYYGDLDSTGHRFGVASELWRIVLGRVDRLVQQLVEALPPGATLVVTSDHGMLDVPRDNRIDLALTPALSKDVVAVSGDLRGAQVHVRGGATSDVLAAWRDTLGSAFWVVPQDEAVAAGLYGPQVADHVRARLGDVLALAVADHVIVDSATMPPRMLDLIGMHGALSEVELAVPLLVHEV